MSAIPQKITEFLLCATPKQWLEAAVAQQNILLMDHAHCEKKAASTILSFLFRYPEREQLIKILPRVAREELRHFEQVIRLLKKRNIDFIHLPPGRYAEGLKQLVRTSEPYRLVDLLIMSAFIEARSCERFASLVPLLEPELAKFYKSLLEAEARHFMLYLELAELYSPEPVGERIAIFAEIERQLILANDDEFRFHSGVV